MDIPASKLNRAPDGLLSFFDIKSMGQYPDELGKLVQPTIDLFRWYADTRSIEVLGSFGAAFGNLAAAFVECTITTPIDLCGLNGTANVLEVPQNEQWLILEANAAFGVGDPAGSNDCCWASGALNGATRFCWPMSLQGFTTGAAVSRTGRRSLDRPFLVLPGHRISLFMFGAVGGALTNSISGNLRLLRLQR